MNEPSSLQLPAIPLMSSASLPLAFETLAPLTFVSMNGREQIIDGRRLAKMGVIRQLRTMGRHF